MPFFYELSLGDGEIMVGSLENRVVYMLGKTCWSNSVGVVTSSVIISGPHM